MVKASQTWGYLRHRFGSLGTYSIPILMSSSKLEPLRQKEHTIWSSESSLTLLNGMLVTTRPASFPFLLRGEVVGNPFIQELIYSASGTLEKLE